MGELSRRIMIGIVAASMKASLEAERWRQVAHKGSHCQFTPGETMNCFPFHCLCCSR